MNDNQVTRADLYKEASETYRYFLEWRNKILAGYFAVLAALALAFGWIQTHWTEVSTQFRSDSDVILPLAVILMSTVFWMLDFRNRDLFRMCQHACADLEPLPGAHRHLQALRIPPWSSHGRALDILVSGVQAAATYALLRLRLDGWVAVLIAGFIGVGMLGFAVFTGNSAAENRKSALQALHESRRGD